MLATTAFASSRSVESLDAQTIKKIAPAKAAKAAEQTWKDLGKGEFSDFVLSNLFTQYYNEVDSVLIQESEQTPGVYRLVNPWKPAKGDKFDESLNYLIIDASDPNYVMIPPQRAPMDNPTEGETWYCSYTYYLHVELGVEKQVFIDANPDRVITMKNGVINADRNSMAVKYPNGTGNEFPPDEWSYANMQYDGYIKLPDAKGDAGEWTSIGKGIFKEGFIETIFDPTFEPEEVEVEVMKNNKSEGVYKVMKAFAPRAETGRDLVIDASQPNFVRIKEQNTGVKTTNGWLYILSVSCNGDYYDYDSMVGMFPEYAARNIYMEGNKIIIPTNSILVYFPEVDYAVYGTPDAKESYLILPSTEGVENVYIDQPMQEEYYNLQGMRVANPAAGQIVVVRKGSQTYKTIIR